MRKYMLSSTLFIVMLCAAEVVEAQLALNKNITRDSLVSYLNVLLKDNSDSARNRLLGEAAVLRNKNTEGDMALALKIYGVLDDSATAGDLKKRIIEKYPNGVTARDQAYSSIFDRNTFLNIADKETAYNKWIERFPPSNFSFKEQGKYSFALLGLIRDFSKKGNVSKVNYYLKLLTDSSIRTIALYYAGTNFFQLGDTGQAKSYLAAALSLSDRERKCRDVRVKNSFGALFYENIVNVYGKLLLQEKRPGSVIVLFQPLLKDKSTFGGMQAESLTITMAKALEMEGSMEEAFSLLNRFLIQHPDSKDGLALVKSLYLSLNPQSKISTYLRELATSQKKFQQESLAKDMIKVKAPAFSLKDMDGNLVKLSDYIGKIVVIDFWATWCAPCLRSFPDMKQLMSHYKNNNQIVFLFINTWENSPDYKKKVNKLIHQNNYPFTVLFDDREESHDREFVANKFKITSLPATFILDENGDIRFRINGVAGDGQSEEETLFAMIDLLSKGMK